MLSRILISSSFSHSVDLGLLPPAHGAVGNLIVFISIAQHSLNFFLFWPDLFYIGLLPPSHGVAGILFGFSGDNWASYVWVDYSCRRMVQLAFK